MPVPIAKERGTTLLIIVLLMVTGGLYLLVGALSPVRLREERARATAEALAQAKETLIGDALAAHNIKDAGYLSLPDLGFGIGGAPSEGTAAANFSGNNKDLTVIGKLPWKTLKLATSPNSAEECLWYVVSGRMKKSPRTDIFNWDTQGQIDVIDINGTIVATNLAALIVAPGPTNTGQSRALADPAYIQCGGNYDARNYLDSYNGDDAPIGEVNYFTGSTNHRLASDSSNKRFVLASNSHRNDRLLFVTVSDIFRLLSRRTDFAAKITSLLDDPDLRTQAATMDVVGSKGTDKLKCADILNNDIASFCNDWKEMLFLTQLAVPAAITLDGAVTPICTRIAIFAGQAIVGQLRISASDKSDKSNYLEAANRAAFGTPIALASGFVGSSVFNANLPGNDILRCLP
jgi:hypothetical protein